MPTRRQRHKARTLRNLDRVIETLSSFSRPTLWFYSLDLETSLAIPLYLNWVVLTSCRKALSLQDAAFDVSHMKSLAAPHSIAFLA